MKIFAKKSIYYAKIFLLDNENFTIKKTGEVDIKTAIDFLKNSSSNRVIVHIYKKNFLKFLGLNIVECYTEKGEKAIVFLKNYL